VTAVARLSAGPRARRIGEALQPADQPAGLPPRPGRHDHRADGRGAGHVSGTLRRRHVCAGDRPVSEALADQTRGVRVDEAFPSANGDMLAIAGDSLHNVRDGNRDCQRFACRIDREERHELMDTTQGGLEQAYEERAASALGGASRPPRRPSPRP
jgi:hypothetical protein